MAAALDYLCLRGMEAGPLFSFQYGHPLTRPPFATTVRAALTDAGHDASKYCTHSFHIGAATTTASKGIEDSIIQALGHWGSLAYLRYVRLPRKKLASVTGQLCD